MKKLHEKRLAEVESGGQPPVKLPLERFNFMRFLLTLAVFAGLIVIFGLYYSKNFTGLWDRNAVDIAQIARNVQEGNGFVTAFIRPFNVNFFDVSHTRYPEVNHAPLYIYSVAAMYKFRAVSDQVVAWTSSLWFFLLLFGTYRLGKILFDWHAALLATAFCGVSVSLLRSAISGNEWCAAAAVIVFCFCFIAAHHKRVSEGNSKVQIINSALAGLCVGLAYLTYQPLLYLAVPVLLYFILTGRRRVGDSAVFVAALALTSVWWMIRNGNLTNFPLLGANTWDIVAHSLAFPGDTFYRSTDPIELSLIRVLWFPIDHFAAFAEKLIKGSMAILQTIASISAPAAAAAGICTLYKFKEPTPNAVRGLCYFAMPFMISVMAVYNFDKGAAVIFAPIIAVYGAGYLLLLVRAKKLHPFFARWIIAFAIILGGWNWMTEVIWPNQELTTAAANPINNVCAKLSSYGYKGVLYTDAPWKVAWCTNSVAVWVPVRDEDIQIMEDRGYAMNSIILTPESSKLSPDEMWYMLHEIRLWREYVRDPQDGVKKVIEEGRVSPESAVHAEWYLKDMKRRRAVSESVAGAITYIVNPLQPDDIQIIEIP